MSKNFIIISSIEWKTHWQTQHRLATSLAKDNKVLFIENTGLRLPKFRDFNRIKDRLFNYLKSTKGFSFSR